MPAQLGVFATGASMHNDEGLWCKCNCKLLVGHCVITDSWIYCESGCDYPAWWAKAGEIFHLHINQQKFLPVWMPIRKSAVQAARLGILSTMKHCHWKQYTHQEVEHRAHSLFQGRSCSYHFINWGVCKEHGWTVLEPMSHSDRQNPTY
jgi:hypothetical protein